VVTVRSALAIRDDGGVLRPDGTRLQIQAVLVVRRREKLADIARRQVIATLARRYVELVQPYL
jgi:hypothetical protein